jgi:hypothetical protein
LPKEIKQENGKCTCLALPYANKRVYEDRLNELAFGEWSTPYVPPFAQGNKLILPVTVIILGVAHTDYGEEYFLTTGKNGTTREDENTATEAYSQAFRRACAQFLLGRYLYDLPKLKLPYDPKLRQIAVSKAERIAWVEKLYQAQGLLPKVYTAAVKPAVAPSSTQTTQEPAATPATLAVQPQAVKTSPVQGSVPTQAETPSAAPTVQQKVSTPPTPQQKAPVQPTASVPQQKASSAIKESKPAMQPTEYQDTFLDWVATQVKRDPERIQGICTFFQVHELAKLSAKQRNDLTRRLRQQASQQRQQSQMASATAPSA